MLTGEALEHLGWRQGSLVRADDTADLIDRMGLPDGENVILLVVSQSCDIACDDVGEPLVEIMVARPVLKEDGNLTFNKNPRALHTIIDIRTLDADVRRQQFVEIKAFEKIPIPKAVLRTLHPDDTRYINSAHLGYLIAWLAARYSRPALPTAFNDRVRRVDPKNKRRSVAKTAETSLSGIYIKILPDKEIGDNENYTVSLLGVVQAGFSGDKEKAEIAVNSHARVLEAAGMNVTTALLGENEVSLSTIKQFKRFYYDDLSYRDGGSPPTEVTTIL